MLEMFRAARIPKQKVWYVTSSYRAAKQIIWAELKELAIRSNWLVGKPNESELTLRLVNGSTLSLRGADSYDSLRGVGINFLVIDEASYVDQRAWREVLRPTLSDTGGKALFISSPSGRDWFYDLWQIGQADEEDWHSWQFTTIQGGRVPESEIDAARRDLDDRTFAQEYEAAFVSYFGVVYHAFKYEENVVEAGIDNSQPLHVGIDFNIDPMSAVVAQIREDNTVDVVDEIVIYSSNTNELCEEIVSRYAGYPIHAYPDPAASQRKTSAGGATDLSILSDYGFRCRYRNRHPAIRDRVNSVNALFCSASGDRRLFVDSECRNVIRSLERQTYKEGTSLPDKTQGYDHINDALGYMIEYLYPVNSSTIQHSKLAGL